MVLYLTKYFLLPAICVHFMNIGYFHNSFTRENNDGWQDHKYCVTIRIGTPYYRSRRIKIVTYFYPKLILRTKISNRVFF